MRIGVLLVGTLLLGTTAAAVALLAGDAHAAEGGLRLVGRVGANDWSVTRNGDTWAWRTLIGAGAEATPWDATRSAIALLVETADAGDEVTVRVLHGDGVVAAGRVQFAGARKWVWTARSEEFARGSSPTRGAAVLELLDVLAAREDDAPDVDPDAPTVPIPMPPHPDPVPPKQPGKGAPPDDGDLPDAGGWTPVKPPNLHELDAAGLARWDVAAALDPDGHRLERSSVVILGAEHTWTWRRQAWAAMEAAAARHPDVAFLLFDLATARALLGVPAPGTMSYVASAIGPDGTPRVAVDVGAKPGSLLGAARRQQLIDYAKHGPRATDPLLFDREGHDGARYVVLVRSLGGSWEALVWRSEIGDDAHAVHRQGGPTRDVARNAALAWIDARQAA